MLLKYLVLILETQYLIKKKSTDQWSLQLYRDAN